MKVTNRSLLLSWNWKVHITDFSPSTSPCFTSYKNMASTRATAFSWEIYYHTQIQDSVLLSFLPHNLPTTAFFKERKAIHAKRFDQFFSLDYSVSSCVVDHHLCVSALVTSSSISCDVSRNHRILLQQTLWFYIRHIRRSSTKQNIHFHEHDEA
jgi:hypothetical protein